MILSSQDKINIKGDINEIRTECIFIMREIYKREREVYGSNEALGYLMDMIVRAIDISKQYDNVIWTVSEEEKLLYTE